MRRELSMKTAIRIIEIEIMANEMEGIFNAMV